VEPRSSAGRPAGRVAYVSPVAGASPAPPASGKAAGIRKGWRVTQEPRHALEGADGLPWPFMSRGDAGACSASIARNS
jgi:hypothetical protein